MAQSAAMLAQSMGNSQWTFHFRSGNDATTYRCANCPVAYRVVRGAAVGYFVGDSCWQYRRPCHNLNCINIADFPIGIGIGLRIAGEHIPWLPMPSSSGARFQTFYAHGYRRDAEDIFLSCVKSNIG